MDIKGILYAVFRGFYDSIRGIAAAAYMDKELNERKSKRRSPTRSNSIKQKPFEKGENTQKRELKEDEKSKVSRKILQCALVNGGIFVMSILFFENYFIPGLKYLFLLVNLSQLWSWIAFVCSIMFQTFWVIPVFLGCKIVNALWFQDIADSAFKYSRGKAIYSQKLSVILADAIISVAIQSLFLMQAVAVSYIPIYIVGCTLSFIQMCMLHSLYAFEYMWFNMGWAVHRRLSFIETYWPYFIGFGFPMAFLTQISENCYVNAGIFGVLFPFFIISSNQANPVTTTRSFPLHFFAPVIGISNCLFSSAIGSPQRNVNSKTAQQQQLS